MQLSYGALSMLMKKYRAILKKSTRAALMAAMLGFAGLCAGPVMAQDQIPGFPVIPGNQILPPGQSLTVTESVAGQGQGEIMPGASLTIAPGVQIGILNSTATNNGDVEIAGDITFSNSDLVNNGNVTITTTGSMNLGQTLTNNGNFVVEGTMLPSEQSAAASTAGKLFVNNGTLQVATTYVEGNSPYSSYSGVEVASKDQLDDLLKGNVILGHVTPVDDMVRAVLNVTSSDPAGIALNASDFIVGSTPEKGKFLMGDMGAINFIDTTATINGDSLTLGQKHYNPETGFDSVTVNGAHLSLLAQLSTDFLVLQPQNGDTFTLESGIVLIKGTNETPYINIKDGEGTLHINGGQLQLGQSMTGMKGGEVNGSLRIGTENLAQGAKYDSRVIVSSGDWTVVGDLVVEKSGYLKVGGDKDVNTGEPLSSNLVIKGSFITNGGGFQGINIATLKTDKLVGNEDFVLNIGGDVSGNLLAGDVQLNGGQINFDPPFGVAGDFGNASVGGLEFVSATVDGRINVGRNSMVTLGSQDTDWLKGKLQEAQTKTSRQWGTDATAALGIRAPQTLAPNGGINVDGAWVAGGEAAAANTARFADKSVLVVDASALGDKPALDGNGTATLKVEKGAQLYVTDMATGQKLAITSNFGAAEIDKAGWEENFATSTDLQDLELLGNPETGEFTLGVKDAETTTSVFPGLAPEIAAVVDVARVTGFNVNSDAAGLRFISRAVDNRYIGSTDANLAAATMESAARVAVAGMAPQLTRAANEAAGAAITQRTTLAQPGGGLVAIDQNGQPVRDGAHADSFALWVMPLYQSTNGFGMEAGNFDYDFNGALGGVALGVDYTIEDMLRLGLSFNIGGGYGRSTGDFNKTTNDMDFWGVGAYAGWMWNNFGLTADVNFTSTYNKVKQDLPSQMQLPELKSDITAWALSTGLRLEYKLESQYLDIIPHAGFRYMNLNVDSYDANSWGTVIDGDSFTQNIWTFPIGVTFTKDIRLDNGLMIKPLLDLNVTPAAGDIKARTKVRFTGVDQEVELKTKIMDYVTYGGTAGIEFGTDNLRVGVHYNGQFGAESSAHGVFGILRYEF